MKETKPTEIYQLKITLKDSRPPIWRRVQLSGDITLAKLHRIIQEVMGWSVSHLHQFLVGATYYGAPDPDDLSETRNEKSVRLRELVTKPKQKFLYEYDFGDDWEHEVVVEKILDAAPGVRYPVCLAGARARPKIAAGSTAMPIFSKRYATPSTNNTTKCSNGSAENSTRRSLI